MSGLRSWLAACTPVSPDALALEVPDVAGDPVDLLVGEGVRVLERARTGKGERRGAYDLLAADALLTYACEGAARVDDPEAALLGIIRRVG